MAIHLPGSKALRRGRQSLPGQVYLVTFVSWERRRHFADAQAATACITALLDVRSWQHSRLLAWVLMPDHWHGLLELGGDDDLSCLVRQLKASSARRVRLAREAVGKVWGAGFHDRALRREDDLVDMARYLVLNPVRAGLVRRVRDYPYWDAIWKPAQEGVAACAAPKRGGS
jgi:REP element-mobilizing transposase RayT